jgi:tetratricopeptide (TPR) repeat protein
MSLESGPTNPHAERTRVLLELKRYADAEKEVVLALGIEPNASHLHAWLAVCLLHRGASREAEAAVWRAIQADPFNDFAYHTSARVSMALGREAEALENIREALRLSPRSPEYYYLLAAIHFDHGRRSDALQVANEGLRVRPDDVACANLRSLCLQQLGRTAEAVETVDRALAQNPEFYWSHENRGSLALAEGDVEKAFAHYREALRLNPLSEQARSGLAQALISRHRIYRLIFWIFDGTGGGAWKRVMIALAAVAVLAYALRRPIRHKVGQVLLAAAAVAYLYWILRWLAKIYVEPFFVLLLLLDKLGRRVLTHGEVLRAAMVIGSLLIGVGLVVAALVLEMPLVGALAIPVVISPWPIIFVLRFSPGQSRRLAALGTVGTILLTVWLLRAAPRIPKYAPVGVLFVCMVVGYFIVCSIERRRSRPED